MNGYRQYVPKNPTKPLSIPRFLAEARVAKYWDMKPWEFRQLPNDQQGELHAIYDVEQEVEGYYHGESMKKSDKTVK